MARTTLNQSQAVSTTLGYAPSTAAFSTSSTTPVLITGLSVTVTVPAGGRRVKITGFGRDIYNSSGAAIGDFAIWRGAVGTGTQIGGSEPNFSGSTIGNAFPAMVLAVDNPGAGTFTYSLSLKTSNAANSMTIEATGIAPSFILVELI